MQIGGFHPFTLTDYPGKPAAIVFSQGCNFRCAGCHNQQLITPVPVACHPIPEDAVLTHLARRSCLLDGIVISGGEPTIQDTLPDFLARLKSLGCLVKLDTNGSQPEMLDRLFKCGLLDSIAMDVKAPWTLYPQIIGVDVRVDLLQESVRIIAGSGIAHEFRTTCNPALTVTQLAAIRATIPEGSPHRIQPYHTPVARVTAIPMRSGDDKSLVSSCRVGNVAGRQILSSFSMKGRDHVQ